MRIKRDRIYILALIIFGLVGISCGPSASGPAEKKAGTRGGTMVYRLSAAPTTFNYLMAADEPTVIVSFFMLSSRLIDFDHKSQKYVPALAESWKPGSDERTIDLKLRDGLKFSDGSDLTADDVVFTLAAIYDERTNSPSWRDVMMVGEKKIEAKAIDKQNVRFTFPEKVASVENYLVNIGVLPERVLKADMDAGKLGEAWKIAGDAAKVVSSGPFVVESAAVGERMTLARNPNYWKKDAAGTQLPYLDKLVFEVVADPNNAIAKLNQNAIDLVDRIRPADYASLNAPASPIKPVDVGPGLGTDYLWFNLNDAKANGEKLTGTAKHEWFTNKQFRRAVATAVDRSTIAMTTLRGLATPIYSFVSPGNKAWSDPNVPKAEYNPEAAGKLLADAGFVRRGTAEAPELFDAKGNRVEFTLVYPLENEPRKLMAAVIQEDLAKLGIKMQVAPIETAGVTERWSKSYDYDAVLLGLAVTDIEPSSFANFLLSSASTHQWRPSQKMPATEWEARIDQLFGEQAKESDTAKRAAAFNEIQRIMADEMPIIPIVARHVASAANARVGNLSPSGIMPYSLWNADELFVQQ